MKPEVIRPTSNANTKTPYPWASAVVQNKSAHHLLTHPHTLPSGELGTPLPQVTGGGGGSGSRRLPTDPRRAPLLSPVATQDRFQTTGRKQVGHRSHTAKQRQKRAGGETDSQGGSGPTVTPHLQAPATLSHGGSGPTVTPHLQATPDRRL